MKTAALIALGACAGVFAGARAMEARVEVALARVGSASASATGRNGATGATPVVASSSSPISVSAKGKYCVVQITTVNDDEARRAARFDGSTSSAGYEATSHVFVNAKRMNAYVELEAVRQAIAHGCDGDWFFVGDDDTLFYTRGIERWIDQKRPQKEWLVAHGNLFEPRKLNESWFTGGSGTALSGVLARKMSDWYGLGKFDKVADVAFVWCGCFDVPFARSIAEAGGRMFHQPNLFLDSCLDCASDRRGVTDTPIVSCHAATMFRSRNPHAWNKRGDEYGEHLREQGYDQHPDFQKITDPVARRAWYDEKCAKTK